MVAHEWRALDRAAMTQALARRMAQERALREILRRGVAQGVFTAENVPLLATAIRQMIAGLGLWHRPEGGLPLEAVIAEHQVLARRLAGAPEHIGTEKGQAPT
jgi:hypothetical protein